MGNFARSLKRGAARNLGVLMTQGQQVRVATKARRMWCPRCARVCDSWPEMKWSQPDPKRKIKTLLCARCETPVVSKTLFDLPPGTPERGLWLKPGPGGWASQEERTKERERDEAGAGEGSPEGGTPGARVASDGRVELGGSGTAGADVPPEHLPGGVGASSSRPRDADPAGAGARRAGRRSRGG